MSETAFGKIWRYKEERYSSMIAQTLFLSASFRDFLLQQVGHNAKDDKEYKWRIETEHDLGKYGRIDIFIDTGSAYIGIENKKWAGLGKDQLEKYSRFLKKRNVNSVLIFLSPSRYPPPTSSVVDCFITYKDIVEWIERRPSDSERPSEFERTYFKKLREYLEELKVSPLSEHEIDSLLHYTPCLRKLRAILEATREKSKSGDIERSLGNYLLASEQIEEVDDLVLFYGFRFSDNWYYDGELLDKTSPECLVYLKYKGKEESPRSVDSLLQKIHDDLLSKQEWNIDKKDDGQFRLAVRRNLRDFKGKDNKDNIVEIEEWLLDAKQVVQDAIARFKD